MNLAPRSKRSCLSARKTCLLILSLAACAYGLAPGALVPRRLSLPSASAATTYTVTTNADSGPGSLRQAITEANASAGTDTINFNLPPGQLTITLLSDLPIISDPLIIDGTTQPGYAGAPVVELDGGGGRSNEFRGGLFITAGNSTVRGLVVNRFNTAGIALTTNGGNVVENCYVGLNPAGTERRPNGLGIAADSTQNRIGGPSPAQRNVVSGNNGHGINISAAGNVVQGNYVGTDAAGAAAVFNNGDGITVAGIHDGTLIGGTAPGAGNLISGNQSNGISGGGGALIQGNRIGTDAAGMSAVPNTRGVNVGGGGNQIGGTEPGARNVISGNREAGVSLVDGATGNVVEGNYIGVAADGTTPLPNTPNNVVGNTRGGVWVRNAENNRIGGTAPGQGNLIAFNGSSGVVVIGSGASVPRVGTNVRGNSIFSNNALAIDLDGNSITPNDAGDADAGANNLQNFPLVTSYSSDGSSTAVAGTLNSRPSTTYSLDFYSNRACEPSGNGEGAAYLGSTQVVTDAAGDAAFQISLPVALASGRAVTATATAPDGSTSEFSPCDAARATGGVALQTSVLRAIEDVGALPITVVRVGGTAGTTTVSYETFGGTATAGVDYLPASGTITFNPNETQKTFTIQILNDSVFESEEESVGVRLTSADGPEAIIAPAAMIVFLLDNSRTPVLGVAPALINEGSAGTTSRPVPVSLSAATGRTVTVDYMTVPGFTSPATPGADFQPVSGTLTFSPGETRKNVFVPIVGDTIDEADETFRVQLANAVNAGISVSSNPPHVTITDDDEQPTISVGDVTVTEGTGGTTVATFPITLSSVSGKLITLGYTAAPGTATAGSDYTPPSPPSILNIEPGQTLTSLSVPVVADSADEADENFFLDLTFGQNVTITRARGTATINDDDDGALPAVYVSDAAASDGTSSGAATSAVFNVRLGAAAAVPVTVSYATADGTAAAGADYTATSGTLTFAAGESQKTVTVPTIADSAAEPEEHFFLNLSNPVNATLGDNQGRATISDAAAEEPLTVSVDDVQVAESSSGQTEARFVLRLSRPHVSQVTVEYTTSPGTARAQSDYNSAFGAIIIPAGSTGTSVSATIVNDALDEENEDFFLTISNPTNGATIADAVGRATILDEDPPVGVQIGGASVLEGDFDTTEITFPVTLTAASGKTVSVQFGTAAGTAVEGIDFDQELGTLTFAPGETQKAITVTVRGDTALEPDESFSVTLSNPTNATVAAATATGVIRNDERLLQFGASAFSTSEGGARATITITRTGFLGAADEVTYGTIDDQAAVPCATANGTAYARCDYATTIDTVTFAPGEAQKTFTVPLIDDSHAEGAETFEVFFTPLGTAAGGGRATVTITDNEAGESGPNPIDTHQFFVRQHYLDFLSREPEAGEPWTKVLTDCPNAFNTDRSSPSAQCDRSLVSSAFFRAPEFELKGLYVFRFYRATLERLPRYDEIIRDMRSVTGQTPEEVFAKRAAFAERWVQREEFANFLQSQPRSALVLLWMNRAQVTQVTTPDPANPEGAQKVTLTTQQLAERVTAGTLSLGQVARAIADSDEVKAREFNRAFVAMQYFGYLRRDPEQPGFDNWLNYLNANPTDFRTMIDGFMNSVEYRLRFGPR